VGGGGPVDCCHCLTEILAEFILGTGNSSVKTRLNMNLGMDKFEFKTSFSSRWDSRLTSPSVWTGKLDGKVRTETRLPPDSY
jgi:hypothetical protein